MRNAFADEITKLAAEDPRIVLLSGDIGNRLFDKFKALCPNRFFNCGIAEANMASVAAGLAMCNLRPITYTITPFNTTRCLEQIRVDMCYHKAPVTIVGTGAGLSYGSLGGTHHSCEDIGMLRLLPNMTVVCPGDALELRALLRKAVTYPGPIYFRIGKSGEPLIHSSIPDVEIGKGLVVRSGTDVCILTTGNTLPLAMQAAQLLENQNISSQIVSMHTVKPLDNALLTDLCVQFPLLCTLEEHSLIGGLGSAVAEWLADHSVQVCRLRRLGTSDDFAHPVGSQEYLRKKQGLTPEAIVTQITKDFSCVL